MTTGINNPYEPPKSTVADVVAPPATGEKASRLSRLGAKFLDGLIGGASLVPAYFAAIPAIRDQRPTDYLAIWSIIANTGTVFYLGVVVCLVIFGFNIFLMRKDGQTIGKKIVGIKVVGVDGSHLPLYRIFLVRVVLNGVIANIPVIGRFYGLADCLMIFGQPRRCAHDYLANSIVINAPAR